MLECGTHERIYLYAIILSFLYSMLHLFMTSQCWNVAREDISICDNSFLSFFAQRSFSCITQHQTSVWQESSYWDLFFPIFKKCGLWSFVQDWENVSQAGDDAIFGFCLCSLHNGHNSLAIQSEIWNEDSLRTWWFFRSSYSTYLLCFGGSLEMGWVIVCAFNGWLTKLIVAIKLEISAGAGTLDCYQFSFFLKVRVLFLELALFLLLSSNFGIDDLGHYYFVTVSAQLC